MSNNRLNAAVIGNAGTVDPELAELARRLGSALISAGFRVVTGGRDGVMEAACQGARQSPEWTEGSVVGVLPSYKKSDANPWCDLVIPTGMQLGRNVIVVSMADVVVAIGGGAGTLSEMALAWQLGKPVVTLGTAGWAGELSGRSLDARRSDSVCACSTAEEAVEACLRLAPGCPEADDINSGWRSSSKRERPE